MPIESAVAVDPADPGSPGYLNPSLMVEADRLARRKAQLRQAAEQAAQQLGIYKPPGMTQASGFMSAVTGTPVLGRDVQPSKLASLAPVLAQGMDALGQTQFDKDSAEFGNRESAAAQGTFAACPLRSPAPTAWTYQRAWRRSCSGRSKGLKFLR